MMSQIQYKPNVQVHNNDKFKEWAKTQLSTIKLSYYRQVGNNIQLKNNNPNRYSQLRKQMPRRLEPINEQNNHISINQTSYQEQSHIKNNTHLNKKSLFDSVKEQLQYNEKLFLEEQKKQIEQQNEQHIEEQVEEQVEERVEQQIEEQVKEQIEEQFEEQVEQQKEEVENIEIELINKEIKPKRKYNKKL
jgi:hypothetical protein